MVVIDNCQCEHEFYPTKLDIRVTQISKEKKIARCQQFKLMIENCVRYTAI